MNESKCSRGALFPYRHPDPKQVKTDPFTEDLQDRNVTFFDVHRQIQKVITTSQRQPPRLLKVDDDYKIAKFVISESSRAKQTWDVYCLMLVVYVSLVVPYRLGLDLDDTKTVRTISIVMDLSFLVDLLLNFLTESYNAKTHTLYNTHRSIATVYLKGWFWIDFLSIFPFEEVVKVFSAHLVKDSNLGGL